MQHDSWSDTSCLDDSSQSSLPAMRSSDLMEAAGSSRESAKEEMDL
jgi:hypothetical protein